MLPPVKLSALILPSPVVPVTGVTVVGFGVPRVKVTAELEFIVAEEDDDIAAELNPTELDIVLELTAEELETTGAEKLVGTLTLCTPALDKTPIAGPVVASVGIV